MIQPAALPAVSGLLPLGEALPAIAAEGLDTADFRALLAIEVEGLSPPEMMPKPTSAALPTLPVAFPEAALVPEGGKDLPLALPNSAAEEVPAPQQARSDNDAPAQSDIAVPAVLAEALVAAPAPGAAEHSVTLPAETRSEPNARLPEPPLPAPAGATRPSPEARSNPAPAPIAPIVTRPAPLAGAEPRELPQAGPKPAQVTLSVIAVPVLPTPHLAGTRLRLTLPTAFAAAPIDAAAPAIAEPQLRLTLPAPGTAPALQGTAPPAAERLRAPDKTALVEPIAEPVAPAAGLPTAPVQTLPGSAPFIPVDPALRPHDFTQLVDRLVAARELVQPQAFAVAVQHGEFGQVQLRFRHDGDALSITMASADPDFARVVSAAPAPVLPALPVETPGQAGPRFDSPPQTAAGGGGMAQSRGGSPERREERSGPADNPAPARQGEGRGSRRSGIFA